MSPSDRSGPLAGPGSLSGAAVRETVPAWHGSSVHDVIARLDTSIERGLSATEAARRLQSVGANALPEGARRSPWSILAAQFTDFMVLVLLVAALVSGVVGEPADAIAILVIVVLNGAIGFFQEWRAEKTMAALRRIGAPHATVLRDGVAGVIDASDLVPGDVVLLDAGQVVPADLRVVEAARLQAQESVLTGESVPVEKQAGAVESKDAPLGERSSMAYRGTLVTAGRGRGVVVATGLATEVGRIAALLSAAQEPQTPLQRRLTHVGRRLAWLALAICLLVFLAGLARGEAAGLMFLTSVSLAVAAIPEALPVVVAVALALGAGAMARRNALVRRLPAVESLGAVTVICTDKTGTLTRNRMEVAQVFDAGSVDGGRASPVLLAAMTLCNDAQRSEGAKATGDPTEIALLEAAEGAGEASSSTRAAFPRVMEIPFDADRKRMTTVHRLDGAFVAYTKGAPERVLDRCVAEHAPTGEQPIAREAISRQVQAMAEQGLRVIAFARREWIVPPEGVPADAVETDLVFLGLAGLADPLRPDAVSAVAECRAAGIVAVMITGDHPATARAIADQLGLGRDGKVVIDGAELERLNDEALRERVENAVVFARATPEHKIRIVSALQARGEIVAMTGDGVNDAPALKRADVGVAMGQCGTDVAREASHLVLLDDHFATIVAAVREGRRIYDNIRKFVRYVLAGNVGEVMIIFLAPFLGLPIPLLPIQILWVNLVTDGLPGLALVGELAEPGLMKRPPRSPAESLFAHGLWQHVLWVGCLIAALCLAVHAWAEATGNPRGHTMVFSLLALAQLAHVMAIRSERESLWRIGVGSNAPLLAAVLLTVALQLAVVYVPVLNEIFHTEPLHAAELLACFALAAVVFVAVEGEKAMIRAGWLYACDRVQPAEGTRR